MGARRLIPPVTAHDQRMQLHLIETAEELLWRIDTNVTVDAQRRVTPARSRALWIDDMQHRVRINTDQVNHYAALWAAAN